MFDIAYSFVPPQRMLVAAHRSFVKKGPLRYWKKRDAASYERYYGCAGVAAPSEHVVTLRLHVMCALSVQAFLFNDLIIFGRKQPEGEQYEYVRQLKLQSVEDHADTDEEHRNMFSVRVFVCVWLCIVPDLTLARMCTRYLARQARCGSVSCAPQPRALTSLDGWMPCTNARNRSPPGSSRCQWPSTVLTWEPALASRRIRLQEPTARPAARPSCGTLARRAAAAEHTLARVGPTRRRHGSCTVLRATERSWGVPRRRRRSTHRCLTSWTLMPRVWTLTASTTRMPKIGRSWRPAARRRRAGCYRRLHGLLCCPTYPRRTNPRQLQTVQAARRQPTWCLVVAMVGMVTRAMQATPLMPSPSAVSTPVETAATTVTAVLAMVVVIAATHRAWRHLHAALWPLLIQTACLLHCQHAPLSILRPVTARHRCCHQDLPRLLWIVKAHRRCCHQDLPRLLWIVKAPRRCLTAHRWTARVAGLAKELMLTEHARCATCRDAFVDAYSWVLVWCR